MKNRFKRWAALLLTAAMLCTFLTACRPSDAITRLMNIENAVNFGMHNMLTNKDAEEETPDDEDPVNEEREDAEIEEEEISVGQLMEELFGDEEKADEALQAIYSAMAEEDWGEQYITQSEDLEDEDEDENEDDEDDGDDEAEEEKSPIVVTLSADHGTPEEDEADSEDEEPDDSSSQLTPGVTKYPPVSDVMNDTGDSAPDASVVPTVSESSGSSSSGTPVIVVPYVPNDGESASGSATTEGDSVRQEIPTPGAGNDDSSTTPSGSTDGDASSDNSKNPGGAATDDGSGEDTPSGGSNPDSDASGSGGGGDPDDEAEGNGNGNPSGGGTEGSTIVPDDGDPNASGDGGSDGDSDLEVNDEDGEKEDPEPAPEPRGGVAATGQLAILVSMLGGGNQLCATSSDYDSNTLAQKAFGADSDYEVLWSGDGSSAMSSANFEELLELQPELCLYVSGNTTFSSDQLSRLEAAGTVCQMVPGFNTATDTEKTVTMVGDLLGDRTENGGKNAPKVASSYITWCGNVENDLKNVSSSATTVYIEGYDSNVKINVERLDGSASYIGSGAAYIRPGTGFRPLSDYLGYAKVSDFAAAPYKATNSSNKLSNWESSYDYFGVGTPNGALAYISPIVNNNKQTNEQYYLSDMRSDISLLTYGYDENDLSEFTFGSVGGLGLDNSEKNFKTVVAADSSTKSALENSWSWGFLRNEQDQFLQVGVNHNYNDLGYFRAKQEIYYNDEYWPSNIMGYYDILVQPVGGMGDWLNGSAESILESVWAAWAIQGYYSESQAKNLISQFYNQFYGYNLSSSELSAILTGN